ARSLNPAAPVVSHAGGGWFDALWAWLGGTSGQLPGQHRAAGPQARVHAQDTLPAPPIGPSHMKPMTGSCIDPWGNRVPCGGGGPVN
nr:hypothetical protein [Acidobacteriota bacterium]